MEKDILVGKFLFKGTRGKHTKLIPAKRLVDEFCFNIDILQKSSKIIKDSQYLIKKLNKFFQVTMKKGLHWYTFYKI